MSKRFISILNFTYRYTMRKTLQKKKKKKKKKTNNNNNNKNPRLKVFSAREIFIINQRTDFYVIPDICCKTYNHGIELNIIEIFCFDFEWQYNKYQLLADLNMLKQGKNLNL